MKETYILNLKELDNIAGRFVCMFIVWGRVWQYVWGGGGGGGGVGVRGGGVAYWGGVFKVTILAFFEWGDFLKKLKE